MAEPVGVTLGVLGISGLISVCLDCYSFVQDGFSVGQSYAQFEADMSHQSVRLFAWAKACGYMGVQGPDARLSGGWEGHVKMQLSCIALLFLDAQKLAGRYRIDDLASRPSIGSSVVGANLQFYEAGLNDALSSIRKTKKKAGLRGFFVFGLRDKKRCEETVQNLEKCLTALEFVAQNLDLFKLERDIIRHEIETSTNVDALQSMVIARPGSDQASLISDAASQRIRLIEDATAVVSGPRGWGGEQQGFATSQSQLSRIEEDAQDGHLIEGAAAVVSTPSSAERLVPTPPSGERLVSTPPIDEHLEPITSEDPPRDDGQQETMQEDVGQNVRIMRELLKNAQEEKPAFHLDEEGWGDRLQSLKCRDKDELGVFLSGQHDERFSAHPKRLVKEVAHLVADNDLLWASMRFLKSSPEQALARVTFEGPPHSVYKGGIFHAAITFESSYPWTPPKFRLLTKIYHPNINTDGEVCMDYLGLGWSTAFTTSKLLVALASLLTDPCVDDPLVPEIAQTYVTDRDLYDRNARMVTADHATTLQSYPEFGVGPEMFE